MRNVTALLFGFVIGICIGLALIPRAHGAPAQPQIHGILAMALAIDAQGAIIGAELIGVPKTLAECDELTKPAAAKLKDQHALPGIQVVIACVDMHVEIGKMT